MHEVRDPVPICGLIVIDEGDPSRASRLCGVERGIAGDRDAPARLVHVTDHKWRDVHECGGDVASVTSRIVVDHDDGDLHIGRYDLTASECRQAWSIFGRR